MIIDLVSHTTFVVCVLILYRSEKFFYSEFLPEICREEITEEIIFVFCFDAWPGARTRALRVICQHTTY